MGSTEKEQGACAIEQQETAVEAYIRSKGYRFREQGDQLNLQVCPFCGGDESKFYINRNNWLYVCHRGSCKASGNEYTLKAQMGDRIAGVSSARDGAMRGQHQQAEPLPNIDAAHQALLEDDAVLNWLNDERGFDLDVVKRFKLGLGKRWFGDKHGELRALMFPYFIGDNCVMVKYRTLPQSIDPSAPAKKDFRSTSESSLRLYNQNAIVQDMEYLILVEGEGDAIAMVANGFENVVSVPGCEGRKVEWDALLDRPRKLYLMFDNDEAGQDGAYKFATRFGIERFQNVVLPAFELDTPDATGRTKGKDVGEWFMSGHTPDELHSLLKASRPFDIEGVNTMDDALAECERDLDENGGVLAPRFKTPWPSLNDRIGGCEKGDLVILMAAPKHGKTTCALNWADDIVANQNASVFFECLEMPTKRLARKWASYITKTDDSPNNSQMTKEVFQRARSVNAERDRDLLWGHTTVRDDKEPFDRIRAVVRRYGAEVVVYDNLHILADATLTKGTMGNRTTHISIITKKFKQLAMELGILIILIAHPKRLGQDEVAGADSLDGSSAPARDTDLLIVAHRNPEARFKGSDLAKLGKGAATTESLSPIMHINVALSRYSSGGYCNLFMEGAVSWIREQTPAELSAPPVRVENSGAITFVNEGEVQAI